jgi:hypothetical protein
MPTFIPLRPRKWSTCLFLIFLGLLLLCNLGTRFLEGGRVVTPLISEVVLSQERTGTKKKIDRRRWGVRQGGCHCSISCTHRREAGRRFDGLSSPDLAPTALGRCGELVSPTRRWQWSVRAAGGGDLSSSSMGDGVGVSGVPEATGKTPMGAVDSGDPFWAVGSMRTPAQGCGSG